MNKINIVFIFLLFLLFIHLLDSYSNNIIEGATNRFEVVLSKDPLQAVQQKTAANYNNIEFLKTQYDKQIEDLTNAVQANADAISAINQQAKQSVESDTGRDPTSDEPMPQATGLD